MFICDAISLASCKLHCFVRLHIDPGCYSVTVQPNELVLILDSFSLVKWKMLFENTNNKSDLCCLFLCSKSLNRVTFYTLLNCHRNTAPYVVYMDHQQVMIRIVSC